MCVIQERLERAISRHGEGMILSLFESLIRCHIVKVEYSPQGQFVKIFNDCKLSSSETARPSSSRNVLPRSRLLQHRSPVQLADHAVDCDADLHRVRTVDVRGMHSLQRDTSKCATEEPTVITDGVACARPTGSEEQPDGEISPEQHGQRTCPASARDIRTLQAPLLPTFHAETQGERAAGEILQDSDFESCAGDELTPRSASRWAKLSSKLLSGKKSRTIMSAQMAWMLRSLKTLQQGMQEMTTNNRCDHTSSGPAT